MTSHNGTPLIKIGRKGKMRVALGDGAPFEFDVVAVHCQWVALDVSFRDEYDQVPKDCLVELNRAAHQFVRELSGTPDVTLAEALEFLKVVHQEAARLRPFFAAESPAAPSSAPDTAVTYST